MHTATRDTVFLLAMTLSLMEAGSVFADDTDNLAELQVKANYSYSPNDSVEGGAGYGVDTLLYSPTFDNHWRLFAGQYYAHENEPNDEGNISLWRSTAGVEYHDEAVKINLAPTMNFYNTNNRVGAAGDVSWTINDHWNVGAGSQLFSTDVPLRALNQGITANSYDTNVMWHQNDQRSVRLDADIMTFSDENVRGTVSGLYTEHLYTAGKFSFDGIVNVTESQDSEDEQVLYFNPKTDLLSSAGLQVTQELYRDGDTVYAHSVQILPGDYWQKNYGSEAALNARYEVRAHFSNTLDAGIDGLFSRQAYDGGLQNSVAALLDLTKRF